MRLNSCKRILLLYYLTYHPYLLLQDMNLNELLTKLGNRSPCDSPPESPTNPTVFYQMECRSQHYYTPKLCRQLPLREVEGFCKVEMRHTTSKFKQGKLIHVSHFKKENFVKSLRRSIQMQPMLDSTVRNEMLCRQNNVVRLPKDAVKSITSHSTPTVSPLPEVES